MSKKTKKGLSLTGLLTIINVLVVVGIALIFVFGPSSAKGHILPSLGYSLWVLTAFNVGSFTVTTGSILLLLFTYLSIIEILVFLILYLSRKSWKSLSAVFCLLLSTATTLFGASYYFLTLEAVINDLKPVTYPFILAIALCIVISYVISLLSCLTGTLSSFADKLGGGTVREIVRETVVKEVPAEEKPAEEPVVAAAVVEEAKEPVNFTVEMVKEYVASMEGENHPVATENKDANGENGPVSNNVGKCNMALTYGKEDVSSLLIRLDEESAEKAKSEHNAEASNFAGSGDYYKLHVNDGSFTEEAQLWDIMEASYAYVLSKYFKIEDGKYVELEEEPVEEEKPAEEPVVEPVVVPVEEDEKAVIERVPFVDKVRRADRDLKDKYDELKQYCLSYGLKSRISIDGDTYRLHTVKYVHITIAGKKMKVYFALNPNDYLTSTTPVKEAKAKKYSDVKAYLDVKSDLSVKRAKALIDTVMANAGIEKAE